jgi:transcriptional regulator with XRE-family HTH domain
MIVRTYYQQMGYRLRATRNARGLSQAQLGAKIGVSQYTIFQVEKVGRTYLDDTKLARIATALGLTVEDVTADGWREACGVPA